MRKPVPEKNPDAGFTLVEVLVSLAVIAVVLTAVSTFFIRSMVITNLEGVRQSATQVASTSMEELRSVPGTDALAWLAANAAPTAVSIGTRTYARTWDVPAASALIAATVHVQWAGSGCPGNVCEYSATTLVSTVGAEPVFDVVEP